MSEQDGRKSLTSNVPATRDGEQGRPGGADCSPFIHLRILSDGAVVQDASGRQRILQMEQIAHIYSIISADFSSAGTRVRIGALQSRAEMNLQQDHPKTAIAAYHDILDTLDQNPTLDIDISLRAAVLHRLGYAYSSLQLAGESELCYLKALTVYRRAFGRDYPSNFTVLNDLAILCQRDGYATEAAELYERALSGRLRVLGQHAPETLSTMQELAKVKISLGDLESALALFEHVVPAYETVVGPQNESTLNAMNHLSMLYQKLGLNEKSLSVSRKMLPYCRVAVGIDSPLTRNAITRYVQDSENFDFPPEVRTLLEHYRHSRSADNLRVLQGLGRAYMNAGLNRDACELFEVLFEELSTIKGADSLESFDALSGLCVSLEYLGSLDKAIQSYGRLLQLAHKTSPDHPARVRMDYARKRVTDLIHRREVLTAERRAWSLFEEGPCVTCQSNTSSLCSSEFCLSLISLLHH
jgi:tetratricopeptide (TPR) repeat protein